MAPTTRGNLTPQEKETLQEHILRPHPGLARGTWAIRTSEDGRSVSLVASTRGAPKRRT